MSLELFYKPAPLIGVGRALMALATVLGAAGLYGQVAVRAANVMQATGSAAPSRTLAEMYPHLPTWWVPESIPAAILVIAIYGVGVWAVIRGKRLRRML